MNSKNDEFVKQKPAIKIRSTILTLLSFLGLLIGFSSLVGTTAYAAVNESMNFQGKLVNSDGTNISDGSYYFRVTVYDSAVGGSVQAGPIDYKYASTLNTVSNASITYTDDTDESTLRAGMVIWNTTDGDYAIIETVDTATNTLTLDRDVDTSPYGWVSGENITTRIQVNDGIFNLKIVELGGMDFNTDSLYVEISFDDTTGGGDALNETFNPRKRLDSVPFAMRAKYADYSLDNYWQRNSGIISLETAGDDLRLGLNEQLQFGDTGQITFEYSGNVLSVTTGSDDINFDSNTLFVDGSENRVGIGTNTPGYDLDVSGTLAMTRLITPYDHVITVDAGGGGDYTTITDAINAINTAGDNTLSAPYIIELMTGIYTEDITLPDYTSIIGRSIQSTTIDGTVTVNSGCHVENMLIYPTGTQTVALVADPDTSTSYLTNTYVLKNGSVDDALIGIKFTGDADFKVFSTFIYAQNTYDAAVSANAKAVGIKHEGTVTADIELWHTHIKISTPGTNNQNAVLAWNTSTATGSDIVINSGSYSVFNDPNPVGGDNDNASGGQIKLDMAFENNDAPNQIYANEGSNVVNQIRRFGDITIGADGSQNYVYFEDGATDQYLSWNDSDFILSDDLLPSADDTYSLGSSSARWQDLYLGPSSLHIGADGNEGIISYDVASNYMGFDPDGDGNSDMFLSDTGFLGLGTSGIPSATLDVRGSANFNADKGNNDFVISSQAFDTLFWIDADQDTIFMGDNFTGLYGTPIYAIGVDKTHTSGWDIGINHDFYNTGGGSSGLIGAGFYAYNNAATTGEVRGAQIEVEANANVATLGAVLGNIDGKAGTVGTAYSFKANANLSGATITDYRGLWVQAPGISSGSITNNYQIYIESPSATTDSYSIYSEGGDNYLGGNLEVAGQTQLTSLTSCDLLYTDATGQLQCGTNMGATWDVYDNTGGQSFTASTTPQTLNLDTERQTNSNYTLATDVVTVNSNGTYELTYTCTLDNPTGGASRAVGNCWLETDTGSGFTEVDGSTCYTYHRVDAGENSCSRTVILDLTDTDDVRVRVQRYSGSDTLETIADASSLTIKKLISSGADLAEIYYTADENIEAGDVVSIDPEIKYGVTKANGDNREDSLGIIASHPGLIIGDTDTKSEGRPVLVALAGRVPVKIDPGSEDIEYGDYVTVSKESGMVRKADKPGLVLGKALENWTKPEESEDKILGVNGDLIDERDDVQDNKTIDILVHNMWYQPEDYTADLSKLMSDYRSGALGGSGGTNPTGWIFEGDSIVTSADVVTGSLSSTTGTFSILNAQSLTIGEDKFIADSQGNLNLAGNLVVAGYISGRYGDVKVRLGDSEGNDKFIIANSNKQEVFSIDSKGGVSIIDGRDASTGFGTISRGSKSSVIKTSQVKANSKVYITFKGDYSPASRYWVSDIKAGNSFRVRLDAETNRDVEFTWWVINSVN